MSKPVFSYIMYMIHELAHAWNNTPGNVYFRLKNSGCIDDYLVPNYEVLHTLGTEYMINDVTEYLENRGFETC